MSPVPMITIIDDDESVRLATESLIRSLGFGASCFACAEDFLGSPERCRTNCVITDVQMPGMSGVELQSRLRAEGDAVPLIFITAFPEERIRRQVDAAGAFGFLAKPFDSAAMIDCIGRALQAGAAARQG
ncbi:MULTISPECIES: response regulator [unclassified Xanthobacter]|uniref:response regulator transcription factor n=1 Tax=unclassified Xanthobacter TaxID=2623496 RepID=UPI001F298D88